MKRTADAGPPPLLEGLLRRLVPASAFEVVAGDLAEEYRARIAPSRPRPFAWLWYLAASLRAGRDCRARIDNASSHRLPLPRAATMRDLLFDLRYACRSLMRSPGLLLAVTVTLALGMGANSAIFAIVYGAVFRPLPFPEPQQLVKLNEVNDARGWAAANVAPANFLDWRERTDSFEDITVHGWVYGGAITGGDRPQWIRITDVFHNFFDVIGVQPVLGVPFGEDATWGGEDPRLVISHRLWISHFGGDPGAVGSRALINGRPRTVGAVMPEGFGYPMPDVDVWDALGWDRANVTEVWFRRAHFVHAVARLQPDTPVETASAELASVAQALEKEFPETNTGMGTLVRPLGLTLVGRARTPLLVLLGAVGLVLLIACANIANMLLSRAFDRRSEIAIRQALGAGRGRIARQLVTESMVLAVIGGAAGVAAGYAFLQVVLQLGTSSLPRPEAIRFDGPVILFVTTMVVAAGLAFGIGPAWQLGRASRSAGPDSLRTASADRRARRARAGLVLVEIALAVVLVTGALLMTRSLGSLLSLDLGFETDRKLIAQLQLPSIDYPDGAAITEFHRDLGERLRRIPEVESVARAESLPLEGSGWTSDAIFEGHDFEVVEFNRRIVDREYFATMGVPLLAGRWFDETDHPDSTPVAVINETLAQMYFADGDAVGQRVATNDDPEEDDWYTVIGVVGAEKLEGLNSDPWPEILLSLDQFPRRMVSIIVGWRAGTERPDRQVRALIAEVGPDLPLISLRTFDDVVAASSGVERLITTVLSAFGVVALALAAIGVGALVSRSVSQRRREIGVRLALGAAPREVVGMLVRDGFGLVAGGLTVGLVLAIPAASALRTMLYEVGPTDPVTFGLVLALLTVVGLAASWIPARSAARVDPVHSLRAD